MVIETLDKGDPVSSLILPVIMVCEKSEDALRMNKSVIVQIGDMRLNLYKENKKVWFGKRCVKLQIIQIMAQVYQAGKYLI